MRDSSGCKKKPIEQVQKPYLRKAKLEPVSSYISENKKTKDGLKELSQAIMENVHIGITLIDYNYKILMVNTMISRYFFKLVCELIGRECFREFEKRESVCPHCPGTRAMETGQPAEIETEGIRDNRLALDALSSGQSEQTEIQCDGRVFSLTFAPVVDVRLQ